MSEDLGDHGGVFDGGVIDDASTDGTSAMIKAEFPSVRLVTCERSEGYIVRRNHGAELARGDIVFSIDDDAEFMATDVVEETLEAFEPAGVGAVAIPFINVHQSPRVLQKAPDRIEVWITSHFVGTAHALRRELFLSLRGYRASLVHQNEERDFALRMLEAGFVTRVGCATPIDHYESPKRSIERMDFYGRRNDVLFAAFNVPFPDVAVHLPGTMLRGILFHIR